MDGTWGRVCQPSRSAAVSHPVRALAAPDSPCLPNCPPLYHQQACLQCPGFANEVVSRFLHAVLSASSLARINSTGGCVFCIICTLQISRIEVHQPYTIAMPKPPFKNSKANRSKTCASSSLNIVPSITGLRLWGYCVWRHMLRYHITCTCLS